MSNPVWSKCKQKMAFHQGDVNSVFAGSAIFWAPTLAKNYGFEYFVLLLQICKYKRMTKINNLKTDMVKKWFGSFPIVFEQIDML